MEHSKLVLSYYKLYREQCNIIDSIKKLTGKSRKPNFPEVVSEYIIRSIRKGSTVPKFGDLVHEKKRIEIKCFASCGPISFGPLEKWDTIVFIDARKNPKIKIYTYNISNDSSIWKNIKVNRVETFEKQCFRKVRPRICFEKLFSQLPKPDKYEKENIENILIN
jgi:hypothetical protein